LTTSTQPISCKVLESQWDKSHCWPFCFMGI